MNKFDLNKLIRPNIFTLKPYASARSEYSGRADIFLDANENSLGTTLSDQNTLHINRYPDPDQKKLKAEIARIKKLDPEQVFLGNGSDEPIDLLVRAFCEPGHDSVIIMPPTYGMYKVASEINNVKTIEVPLTKNFQPSLPEIKKAFKNKTVKLNFICSPNNPTGNIIKKEYIERLLVDFRGLIILDEAYIDFCRQSSFVALLNKYPNLVILQTFSKAWGLAGARLGMAFASQEIIAVLNKIKYPYNINTFTQSILLRAIKNDHKKNIYVNRLIKAKNNLAKKLSLLPIAKKIYPSDANFILVKFENADNLYRFLTEQGIIVRNRSKEVLCGECLRITVGTPYENNNLIKALQHFSP